MESKNKIDIETVLNQSPLTTQLDAIYQMAEWNPPFWRFQINKYITSNTKRIKLQLCDGTWFFFLYLLFY